ncbi:uncharacterized protein [Patagioenas fasciata]|uniref:uncharacterized protein n=1 Tax=Patagioenas fasciata TaxID=372321 RepID=UPI003A99A12E
MAAEAAQRGGSAMAAGRAPGPPRCARPRRHAIGPASRWSRLHQAGYAVPEPTGRPEGAGRGSDAPWRRVEQAAQDAVTCSGSQAHARDGVGGMGPGTKTQQCQGALGPSALRGRGVRAREVSPVSRSGTPALGHPAGRAVPECRGDTELGPERGKRTDLNPGRTRRGLGTSRRQETPPGPPSWQDPPMADGDQPPRRAPTPAGTHGPGTQPCRAVRRVHAFGKGGQALRRDPRAPPAIRGWLHKQDSSGLRLWKRRWFVLVDLCLYYYRDSSEQQVRGGLPLPGYEIRILPPAPRTPRYLFTAEHPGMRTYCLGAETPEELNAWVCALRRGASPLSGSPGSLSLQTPLEPPSAGPLSPLSPAHPPGWCSLCPPREELGGSPIAPPRRPLVPPLPPGKEEAPAQRESCRMEDTRGEPPVCAGATAEGRSPRELRPPGAQTDEPPSSDAAEQDIATNQTLTSATGFSDWLLAYEALDEAPPSPGTASPPPANEASLWWRASGRSLEREGVAGRGARRPIRITLLQASF